MTPRLTRRGLFAAGIAAVIGTRATSAAPKAIPGLYTAPASTYVSGDSTVSNLTVTMTPSVPAGTMVEGQVYCERCHADVFPDGGRIDENHYAVRFGHAGSHDVSVNGKSGDVYAIEAYADPNGWVIREATAASHQRHVPHCDDCLGVLFRLERGHVRVWPLEDR